MSESEEICVYPLRSVCLWLQEFPFFKKIYVSLLYNFLSLRNDILLFYLHTASPLILTFIQIVLYRKNSVFWDITPRNQLKVNRSFGGTFLCHFKSRKINQLRNQHEAGNKHGLHGAISHETELLVITTERNSNPTRLI